MTLYMTASRMPFSNYISLSRSLFLKCDESKTNSEGKSHFESGCYPNPSLAQKPLTYLRSHCWLFKCHEKFKFLPISLRFISVDVEISPMLASPILIFVIVVFNPLSVQLRPGWNWSVAALLFRNAWKVATSYSYCICNIWPKIAFFSV